MHFVIKEVYYLFIFKSYKKKEIGESDVDFFNSSIDKSCLSEEKMAGVGIMLLHFRKINPNQGS